MPTLPSPIEACKVDLFATEVELRDKYPVALAERIMRLREMYNYWLANPSMKDRQLRDAIVERYNVSQSTAYSDINIIHSLVPLLSQKSREFHRARVNEMFLEAYALAKEKEDAKTMGRIAESYAKYNDCDKDEELALTYDEVKTQPFCATSNPEPLGIKPIPDLQNYIARLTRELSRDFADIVDVEYEDADLEEDILFAPINNNHGQP